MQVLFWAILWLAIWSGYDTTYFTDNFNSFNKWRSLLPLVAIIAFFNLQFSILSPLGLIMGYTLIGIFAAFFSTRNKYISWWWAIMFFSPLIVASNSLYLMNINWAIACFLSLGLVIYFLSRPNVFKSITFNSLISNRVRPFEGWLGVTHETSIMGIVGSRPTGLARYSGIASLVMLCLFVNSYDWYWLIGFILFTAILLFSKGRMEMGAFIVSMGFILFVSHNLLTPLIIIYLFIISISAIIIFGHIPYRQPGIKPIKMETSLPIIETKSPEVPIVQEVKPSFSQKTFTPPILTLGGRTNGVWQEALILIKKSPLIGYGFGIERYLLKDYLGRPASVDNTLLNALLQSGVLGASLFLISIIWTISMGYHLINPSLINLEVISVGIFILLRGITQSFSSYSADWLFLIPIIAYIQLH